MYKRNDLYKMGFVLVMGACLSVGMFSPTQQSAADEKSEKARSVLLKQISQSKVSLADGMRQESKGTAVPVSAKYELDDNGELSLSVYTAEKGLGVTPEENVFKETAGSPNSMKWNPESEVIKDPGDLTKARKQLMILSQGKISLMYVVEKAGKEHQGTIIAVRPEKEHGKFVCEVRIAADGKVHEFHYDVVDGNEVKMNEKEKS